MNVSPREIWAVRMATMRALFARIGIRADAANDPTIIGYRTRQEELLNASQQILGQADHEKRELTAEEKAEIAANSGEVERLDTEIELRNKVSGQFGRLTAAQPRKTAPEQIPGDEPLQNQGRQTHVQTRALNQPNRATAAGTQGFRNFGEFARSVYLGSAKGGDVDPRLRNATPSTVSSEGVGADGGFAVPTDFKNEIVSRLFGEQSLMSLTDQHVVTGNSMAFPVDVTTPWQTTGGIQAYWGVEAGLKTQSKISLQQAELKLNKIYALVPVTDELLEDAPALDSYLRRKAPEKINWKVNDSLIWGDGVGKPLGIMNSAALVTVSAEGSQTADTINATNVAKMYARMPSESRRTAVWLINADAEVQFPLMTISDQPVYLPPGGFTQNPYSSLFGRPVIAHSSAKSIGDLGDIIFADFKQYLTLTKAGGMKTDVSIHLWFDYDVTAFRFVMRVAGQPWINSTITPANGSNALSPFVTLAAR